MANLTQLEKQQFEDVFGMSSGYVMKDLFNDAKYADLFKTTANLDIWADKHAPNGRSKAKCMRAFEERSVFTILTNAASMLALPLMQSAAY